MNRKAYQHIVSPLNGFNFKNTEHTDEEIRESFIKRRAISICSNDFFEIRLKPVGGSYVCSFFVLKPHEVNSYKLKSIVDAMLEVEKLLDNYKNLSSVILDKLETGVSLKVLTNRIENQYEDYFTHADILKTLGELIEGGQVKYVGYSSEGIYRKVS